MRFLSERQSPSEMEDKLCVEGEVKEWSLGDLGNLQDYVLTPEIVGDVVFICPEVGLLWAPWCCFIVM